MARNMYGATSADFTLTSGGRVVPGAVLTVWTARTGGTQITDLLDRDSVACTTVTSAADGSVVYYGPNNDKTVHWADSGQGSRVAIRPVDITGAPPALSIGTVGTGTAGATLTGTSEAPVLNLTLPSAGANGVDTAAIQDSAVTSAKIANGTIVDADINAAAAIAATKISGTALVASTVDAKGDLLTGTANDTVARLAAGADGTLIGYDSTTASGLNVFRVGNLLTANQASIETGAPGFGTNRATITRSSDYALHGTYSLKAEGNATGVASVRVPNIATSGTPVVAGETYTGVFWIMSPATTTAVQPTLQFWDAVGNALSSVSLPAVAVTSSWAERRVTAVAPATAAYVTLYVQWASAASETYYLDCFGIWKGASGVWAMPGTPIVGQSHIAVNNAVHLSGTGTPGGVVTAAPGSTWLQTDATTDVKGWIRWIKATGTGNTGWVAGPEADTGWRDISSLFDTGVWTPHATLPPAIRRTGTTVFLAGRIESAAAWSTVAALTSAVPTGFRTLDARAQTFPIRTQSGGVSGPGAHHNGIIESGGLVLSRNAAIATGNADAANTIAWITSQWTTHNAWPASLPGTAL